ncbi:MAG: replicative DNA helicase [Chloroflexota bacterium]|jgi:replicative DNA helicase
MAVDRIDTTHPIDRLPPQNPEAEEAVLGSILMDPEAVGKVAAFLKPEDFYRERNGAIYTVMLDLYDRHEPVDFLSVSDELKRIGRYEEVGGLAYLSQLVNVVPTAVHIEHYAQIVERTAIKRRLISAAGKIAAVAYDDSLDVDTTIEKAEQVLFGVAQRRSTKDFEPLNVILADYLEEMQRQAAEDSRGRGIPTGFIELEKLTGGLQRSDLIILAARPSMGKSSWALNIVQNAALRHNVCCAIFSLEMSKQQLAHRLLCSESGVDATRMRTGNINESEQRKLNHAFELLSAAPIYIDDTPSIAISELRAKARRLHNEVGIDLLVVDYLQLATSGRGGDNRVQEISEISRSLKALARELNAPVIALSQLSRAVEARTPHIPMLSDLRESGCLAGETAVYLPDLGVYRPIEQLAGQKGFRVLAINTENWQLEPCTVSRAFPTGRKPVFKLVTRLGRNLRATANHKFLTIDGWKRLDELSVGTRIALPRRLCGPENPSMTDDELALLGHLIGDGCTLARQPIHYTTKELGIAETVASLATKVFGDAVKPRICRERNWYQVYLAASYRLTHGVHNPVATWLEKMRVFNLRSYEKRVPEQVFAQPEAGVATFLRHLWSTDGCIRLGTPGHSQPAIYYASSSADLACDVQSLLLRLGINATLRRKPQNGKGLDQYHVVIDGKLEIERFLNLVGALGDSKQEHRIAILKYLEGRVANTNRDIIPRQVWRQVAIPAMQKTGLTTRQMQDALGNSYCGTALYKQNISRQRAARLAQVVQSQELSKLSQSDIYWDEVVSIQPDGDADVYDLTVDPLHNFVAGNIVVHNSIEQDADVVLFIYREDMYDKETEKKGIADIYVAKHRNGPTGQFSLLFLDKYTRFVDLEAYRYE